MTSNYEQGEAFLTRKERAAYPFLSFFNVWLVNCATPSTLTTRWAPIVVITGSPSTRIWGLTANCKERITQLSCVLLNQGVSNTNLDNCSLQNFTEIMESRAKSWWPASGCRKGTAHSLNQKTTSTWRKLGKGCNRTNQVVDESELRVVLLEGLSEQSQQKPARCSIWRSFPVSFINTSASSLFPHSLGSGLQR